MKYGHLLSFAIITLVFSLSVLGGCSMMQPPAIEEEPGAAPLEEAEPEATVDAEYTRDQVIEAITTTLQQYRFTVKSTDVANAEVETEWRREEAFEGGGPGAGYGSEDIYRSNVVVSFDFQRNRVNIRREAQFLDFYINDWRDVTPRRYHREEDMEMQNVIMQYLGQMSESGETGSPETESPDTESP